MSHAYTPSGRLNSKTPFVTRLRGNMLLLNKNNTHQYYAYTHTCCIITNCLHINMYLYYYTVSKVIRQCRCVYSTCLAGLFCTSYMYMHILCTHVHVHGHYVCSLGSRPSPLHHSIASVNCAPLQGRGTLSKWGKHPRLLDIPHN